MNVSGLKHADSNCLDGSHFFQAPLSDDFSTVAASTSLRLPSAHIRTAEQVEETGMKMRAASRTRLCNDVLPAHLIHNHQIEPMCARWSMSFSAAITTTASRHG